MKKKLIFSILLFIGAVAISYMLMPHVRSVEQHYDIGKPWHYDNVMADHDFAIYKTENQLNAERDSALKSLSPYITIDTLIGQKQISRYVHTNQNTLSSKAMTTITDLLKEVYKVGILQIDDKKSLDKLNIRNTIIVNNNIGKNTPYSTLHTTKSAYSYIMTQIAAYPWIDNEVIKNTKLEDYLKANLSIDVAKTELARKEITDQIMLTQGMVQKGELIVAKGEKVTPDIAQLLESLKKSNDEIKSEGISNIWSIIGTILYIMLIYTLLFIYLYQFRNEYLYQIKYIICMLIMSVVMVMLMSITMRYSSFSQYIVPFTMLPLIIRLFMDSRTALYVHMTTILVVTPLATSPLEFALIEIMAGMIAVSSLKDLNSRSQLIRSALVIVATYILAYTASQFSQGYSFANLSWRVYVSFCINGTLLLLTYGLIYIIEKVFGFMSGMTLIELSNINNSLLMKFSEKCPGTFQHVLQVSNLSVEVAKAINANPLLTRTGALYHDIGKMNYPMYYTENQTNGNNPLSTMEYSDAAQIIISHVKEGIKIAQKDNIPEQIIHFIETHHGKSKVKYFYNSYKNANPDKEIDEALFTYPGPLPDTKETAIVMMTDAVEATSRSLKVYDEESISTLVENIINAQIADGLLKNAPITFSEVEIAKAVFKEKLKNIYHSRIAYPELKNNEAK